MARFRKRGETWTAEVRRKGFKPVARTFEKKADAEKWAAEVEAKMLTGRYVDTRKAEATSLGDALDRYACEVTPTKKGAARELQRVEGRSAGVQVPRRPARLRSGFLARCVSESRGETKYRPA